MIFVDTSIVLAYYLPEVHSSQAQAIYRSAPFPSISDLVELETYSAFSRLVRTGSVELGDARELAELFTRRLEGDL